MKQKRNGRRRQFQKTPLQLLAEARAAGRPIDGAETQGKVGRAWDLRSLEESRQNNTTIHGGGKDAHRVGRWR